MEAYIAPIKTAMVTFPFLAFFISGILLIIEYRRFGVFLMKRALILYSFIFYLLCAYFLVILPLPSREAVAHYSGEFLELRPFYFVVRFFQETVLRLDMPATYIPALKQGVVLEPIFNVLLLLPCGVYLRYYFQYSLKKVILASFLLSLFFELTQLTGLYFIYPRPYRLADVNDLINNTLGGTIGYVIAPVLTFFLPSRENLDEVSYEKGQSVSYLRRFVAFVIDWFCIGVIQSITQLILTFVPFNQTFLPANSSSWFFIMVFLYFMLLSKATNGETLGKKIVRLRVVERGKTTIRFRALCIRYGYFYFLYGGIGWFVSISGDLLNDDNRMVQLVSLMLFLLSLLLWFLFIVNIGYSILRKKPQLFYERASHTYVISTIQNKKEAVTENQSHFML